MPCDFQADPEQQPLTASYFQYDPTLAPGIVFSIVFGLIMLAHTVQTIQYRKWWYFSFAIGALAELMGWTARAAAHACPYNKDIFSLQIAILIIGIQSSLFYAISNFSDHVVAPCFYSAGVYYILGQMISQYGRAYSPLPPRVYLFVFIGFDLVSIAIQGTGGGLASSAGSKIPPGNTAPGTHTMLAGIIVQLVSMSFFVILYLYFVWAARALPFSRTAVAATSFVAALILIRNFYRAVELSQGWDGYLITHEIYFTVLDGALMALAPLTFNIFYPARYLTGNPEPKSELMKKV